MGQQKRSTTRGWGGVDLKIRNGSESMNTCLHLSQSNRHCFTCPSHDPACVCGDFGLGSLCIIQM